VVLTLLFLVLGPLALPLLWRSRRFTLRWKIVLTVIVAGITVYVLWQVWYVLNQAMGPLQELRKLQGF
jgi:RsiW-degrading membrane proteinase PrsW (M82 family)